MVFQIPLPLLLYLLFLCPLFPVCLTNSHSYFSSAAMFPRKSSVLSGLCVPYFMFNILYLPLSKLHHTPCTIIPFYDLSFMPFAFASRLNFSRTETKSFLSYSLDGLAQVLAKRQIVNILRFAGQTASCNYSTLPL